MGSSRSPNQTHAGRHHAFVLNHAPHALQRHHVVSNHKEPQEVFEGHLGYAHCQPCRSKQGASQMQVIEKAGTLPSLLLHFYQPANSPTAQPTPNNRPGPKAQAKKENRKNICGAAQTIEAAITPS